MKKILFFLAALLAATTAFQAHALSSGNAVAPSPKRLLLTYNILNLPHTATLRDADNNVTAFVTYGYLADGTKVSAVPDPGQDPGDDIVIDPSDTLAVLPFRDVWHIKDHLGNVRVAVDISVNIPESGVIERSDYLPFGTRVEHGVFDSCNLWRFAAKEEQRFGSAAGSLSAGLSADLALLDFGARYLDPFTARWTMPDPLADKFPSMTPFNYCGNDPVNFFDPDGREKIIAIVHAPKMNEPKYNDSKDGMRLLKRDQKEYRNNLNLISAINDAPDYKNIVCLYAHGAEEGNASIIVDKQNYHKKTSPQELQNYLNNYSTVVSNNNSRGKGSVIVLNSCKTGKDENSLGARLSSVMSGSLIIAPSINVDAKGNAEGHASGKWNIFYGGKIVGSFNATQEDYVTMLKQINENPSEFIMKYE